MMNENNIKINESLLMAYINKELTIEKQTDVEQWLKESEENKSVFDNLKKTWDMTGELTPEPVLVDTNKAWNTVFSKITPSDNVININTKKPNQTFKYILAVAAMLAIIFMAFKFTDGDNNGNINLAANNSILSETLADGSKITLNENSSLSYPEEFTTNERRVNLKGEAFFNIKRNEEKPFIIELANSQYVKVLGTSFNIKANDSDSLTTVYVSTGKVEFGNDKDKTTLIAGETGVINNKTKKVYKIIDKHSELKERYWQNQYLSFKGEKLKEVVHVLNEIFDTEIIINCEATRDMKISASFKNNTLEYILEVISQTNELSIKQDKSKIKNTYSISCNED